VQPGYVALNNICSTVLITRQAKRELLKLYRQQQPASSAPFCFVVVSRRQRRSDEEAAASESERI
jgi:hypothetical protein